MGGQTPSPIRRLCDDYWWHGFEVGVFAVVGTVFVFAMLLVAVVWIVS